MHHRSDEHRRRARSEATDFGREPGHRSTMPPKKPRGNADKATPVTRPKRTAPIAKSPAGRGIQAAASTGVRKGARVRVTSPRGKGSEGDDEDTQPISKPTVSKPKRGRPPKGRSDVSHPTVPIHDPVVKNPSIPIGLQSQNSRHPTLPLPTHAQPPPRRPRVRPNPRSAGVPPRPQSSRRPPPPPRSAARVGPQNRSMRPTRRRRRPRGRNEAGHPRRSSRRARVSPGAARPRPRRGRRPHRVRNEAARRERTRPPPRPRRSRPEPRRRRSYSAPTHHPRWRSGWSAPGLTSALRRSRRLPRLPAVVCSRVPRSGGACL